MTEITIRTDNNAALQKLLDFISLFGFQIVAKRKVEPDAPVSQKGQNLPPNDPDDSVENIPVQWAENPEKTTDLFGIWKNQKMTQAELRKLAWGDRL